MKRAVFTDEFLSRFRLDDNGKTLVLTDIAGDTRAVTLEEEKRGEWVIKKIHREKITYTRKQIAHCPYCLHMEDRGNVPNFCSNCGADMRGEEVLNE